MSRKLFLAITSLVLGTSAALSCGTAYALTPLTSAEIREIVRRVQFVPKGKPARDAILSEIMQPEDALHTMRSSRVGLRFNDGSWARVGEMAVFRFVPGTRNFRLTNGTVLLLIKPGQGRTTIDTPNASAGVRGSALFVRYDEQTETTVVGALTNNPAGPMEILDNTTGRKLPLEAGQMAIVDPLGIRLFNFDMHRFYETSDIVRGLDLQRREMRPSSDPAIAAVQVETAQALKEHKPLTGAVIENPRLVQLSPPVANPTTPSQNSNGRQPSQTSAPAGASESQPNGGTGSNTTASTTTPPSDSAKPSTGSSQTTPGGTSQAPSGGQTSGGTSTQPATASQTPGRQVIEQSTPQGAVKDDSTNTTGTSTNSNSSNGESSTSTDSKPESANKPGGLGTTTGGATSGTGTSNTGGTSNTNGSATGGLGTTTGGATSGTGTSNAGGTSNTTGGATGGTGATTGGTASTSNTGATGTVIPPTDKAGATTGGATGGTGATTGGTTGTPTSPGTVTSPTDRTGAITGGATGGAGNTNIGGAGTPSAGATGTSAPLTDRTTGGSGLPLKNSPPMTAPPLPLGTSAPPTSGTVDPPNPNLNTLPISPSKTTIPAPLVDSSSRSPVVSPIPNPIPTLDTPLNPGSAVTPVITTSPTAPVIAEPQPAPISDSPPAPIAEPQPAPAQSEPKPL